MLISKAVNFLRIFPKRKNGTFNLQAHMLRKANSAIALEDAMRGEDMYAPQGGELRAYYAQRTRQLRRSR